MATPSGGSATSGAASLLPLLQAQQASLRALADALAAPPAPVHDGDDDPGALLDMVTDAGVALIEAHKQIGELQARLARSEEVAAEAKRLLLLSSGGGLDASGRLNLLLSSTAGGGDGGSAAGGQAGAASGGQASSSGAPLRTALRCALQVFAILGAYATALGGLTLSRRVLAPEADPGASAFCVHTEFSLLHASSWVPALAAAAGASAARALPGGEALAPAIARLGGAGSTGEAATQGWLLHLALPMAVVAAAAVIGYRSLALGLQLALYRGGRTLAAARAAAAATATATRGSKRNLMSNSSSSGSTGPSRLARLRALAPLALSLARPSVILSLTATVLIVAAVDAGLDCGGAASAAGASRGALALLLSPSVLALVGAVAALEAVSYQQAAASALEEEAEGGGGAGGSRRAPAGTSAALRAFVNGWRGGAGSGSGVAGAAGTAADARRWWVTRTASGIAWGCAQTASVLVAGITLAVVLPSGQWSTVADLYRVLGGSGDSAVATTPSLLMTLLLPSLLVAVYVLALVVQFSVLTSRAQVLALQRAACLQALSDRALAGGEGDVANGGSGSSSSGGVAGPAAELTRAHATRLTVSLEQIKGRTARLVAFAALAVVAHVTLAVLSGLIVGTGSGGSSGVAYSATTAACRSSGTCPAATVPLTPTLHAAISPSCALIALVVANFVLGSAGLNPIEWV